AGAHPSTAPPAPCPLDSALVTNDAIRARSLRPPGCLVPGPLSVIRPKAGNWGSANMTDHPMAHHVDRALTSGSDLNYTETVPFGSSSDLKRSSNLSKLSSA